jgi:RND family efflux transporter MFP subunit
MMNRRGVVVATALGFVARAFSAGAEGRRCGQQCRNSNAVRRSTANQLSLLGYAASTTSVRVGRLIAYAACALIGLELAACSDAASQQKAGATGQIKPALTVGVTGAKIHPMTQVVIGTGSVAEWQQLTVAAEVAGLRIVEIAVDEGDTVKQGQILARLDDRILKAQSAQFEASIREQEANLANAQADFRRAQELQTSKNIAMQTYEQRETAARTAEAKLAMIRAQATELKAKIEQTVIRAPTDGVISKRSALLGSVAGIGTELFRMIREGRIEVQALVPELDIGRIEPGQKARVVHGDIGVSGTVRLVSPVVNAATRLGMAYVTVPPDSGLKPGMFARAEIAIGTLDALSVPQEALVFRDGRPAAFAVGADDRVTLHMLETGRRQNGWVEVKSGLDRADRIVVAGAGFLNDGDLVRIDSAAVDRSNVTE